MEENWVVFPSSVKDDFSVFSIDAAFESAAPLQSHPFVHWVILNYAENGFPDQECDAKLVTFEDQLVEYLAENQGAYVGRFTSVAGTRQLFFYVPTNIIEGIRGFVENAHFEYDVMMNVKEDEKWSLYSDFLYPSDYDWQRINLQQILMNLRKHGDVHEIPRNIDHFAYFETENGAQAFEEYLSQGDFSAVTRTKAEDKWNITFQQFTAVEVSVLEPVVLSLFEKSREIGGNYDGWGSPVVNTPEN